MIYCWEYWTGLFPYLDITRLWRIQAKENSQDAPDGSDIDLFSGIYNSVIALSEQEHTRGIDCKIYQPLILQEKTQHCKREQQRIISELIDTTKTHRFWDRVYEKKCKYCKQFESEWRVNSLTWTVHLYIITMEDKVLYQEHQWHWLELFRGEGQYLWAL